MSLQDPSSDSKTVTPELHGERITQPKYNGDSQFLNDFQNEIEQ